MGQHGQDGNRAEPGEEGHPPPLPPPREAAHTGSCCGDPDALQGSRENFPHGSHQVSTAEAGFLALYVDLSAVIKLENDSLSQLQRINIH